MMYPLSQSDKALIMIRAAILSRLWDLPASEPLNVRDWFGDPHSFTPDPGTDDELCLTCCMPLDHPNHSESW